MFCGVFTEAKQSSVCMLCFSLCVCPSYCRLVCLVYIQSAFVPSFAGTTLYLRLSIRGTVWDRQWEGVSNHLRVIHACVFVLVHLRLEYEMQCKHNRDLLLFVSTNPTRRSEPAMLVCLSVCQYCLPSLTCLWLSAPSHRFLDSHIELLFINHNWLKNNFIFKNIL